MGRIIIFIYGLAAYLLFIATIVYAICFVGNFVVHKSIDSGIEVPLSRALFIDVGLFALFAIQHSVMARQQFKKWWTKIIPEPAERSTYVLSSCFLFILLKVFYSFKYFFSGNRYFFYSYADGIKNSIGNGGGGRY